MKSSFHADGFRDLDRTLAKLARGVPEARVRAALHAGGQIIADEAKRLAPVDTGLLRDSIEVTDERDARIYGTEKADGVTVYVGPVGSVDDGDVYYARFQEFGTVRHAAQPFMRPAIAAKRPMAQRVIAADLAAAVLEQAK